MSERSIGRGVPPDPSVMDRCSRQLDARGARVQPSPPYRTVGVGARLGEGRTLEPALALGLGPVLVFGRAVGLGLGARLGEGDGEAEGFGTGAAGTGVTAGATPKLEVKSFGGCQSEPNRTMTSPLGSRSRPEK